MHGRRCSKLKFANLGELISTARLKLIAESSWTSSDTLFSFFLVSCPDCIDSESRCPFDWLCFLLEIQVTSITGRFYLTQSFLVFHNKQMLAMQYLNVFICLIFLLKQFCVDFFRKQFPGTLILTYLQWSLDPTFLARSVNSSDLIFISLCQLLYISLRFSGENFIFYQDQS